MIFNILFFFTNVGINFDPKFEVLGLFEPQRFLWNEKYIFGWKLFAFLKNMVPISWISVKKSVNKCFNIFIIWKMSQSKMPKWSWLLDQDIFQIIKILKHSLNAEFLPDIPDIDTIFFLEKGLVFNQIYFFEFTRIFGVQKFTKLQILGQNWCHH